MVAFSGRADLKVNVEEACVVYMSQVLDVIRQFDSRRLSWGQDNSICSAILSVQLEPGKEANRQHKQDAYIAREQKYEALSSGKCPRCGGTLILRNGRYGEFYGCSNSPKCRFTHEY